MGNSHNSYRTKPCDISEYKKYFDLARTKYDTRTEYCGDYQALYVRENNNNQWHLLFLFKEFKDYHLFCEKDEEKYYNAFLSVFSRYVNKYISNNAGLVQRIPFNGKSRHFNYDVFCSLSPKEYFWGIDIDNCYWQALYRYGVIPEKFYRKYCDNHHFYKTWKIGAVSLLPRYKYSTYTSLEKKGDYILNDNGSIFMVSEAENARHDIYHNIKTWGNLCIMRFVKKIGMENTIEWTRDSVFFKEDYFNYCSKYFKKLHIDIKFTYCRKIDNYTLIKGNEIIKLHKKITHNS
jgi:hypothetical protein